MEIVTWLLIVLCISQSAIFSGLNLAFFSISKLRLEIESTRNNPDALKVLRLRKNSNFLLVTILWGNVGVNVLLAMLSNSVLTGVLAFLFSTVVITIIGEIIPQAYFSRNALKMVSLFSPVIRVYTIVLYPLAKPTAMILDRWLGPEAIRYFKEDDFRELMKLHIESSETDIGETEGIGALNFLDIDDIPIAEQGNTIDDASIIILPFENNRPLFPDIEPSITNPFLAKINSSGRKWLVLVDGTNRPRRVLRSDSFLRGALFNHETFDPQQYCFTPTIIYDRSTTLGEAIPRLTSETSDEKDDTIDKDILIVWGEEKRIITGSDILGKLLRGIVRKSGM